MSEPLWMGKGKTEPFLWVEQRGMEPFLATALHSGHELRPELAELTDLDEATRLREEDPYTDYLTRVVDTRIVPVRSRFEVDLNRRSSKAVYRSPEDAWSLHIWKHPPDPEMVRRSLEEYRAFYLELRSLLDEMEERHRRFVIFDIHSYNYRREGPDAPPADPELNPDINVGTGTMDRSYWAPLVERFIADLHAFDFPGRRLDVRENVKFKGRHFARWIHGHYPESACVLSLEFKKFFMDEWTGEPDRPQLQALFEALRSTVPGLIEELTRR